MKIIFKSGDEYLQKKTSVDLDSEKDGDFETTLTRKEEVALALIPLIENHFNESFRHDVVVELVEYIRESRNPLSKKQHAAYLKVFKNAIAHLESEEGAAS